MSKKWKPHASHGAASIVRGPATRIYRGPSKARLSLKFLKRLEGKALADWATRLAALQGRGGLTFTYDEGAKLYVSRQGDEHAFSHPRRIWTMFHGHISRGRNMVYEYLLDQIEFRDDDWILDVGANTGDLALGFRALGRDVNIEAFEPAPGEFAALSRNLAAASAVREHRVHQLALWNEESEGLTFHMKAGDADSSILPIPGATEQIHVPSRRLDDVIGDDGRRFRLLKLEAEGVEPEILEGAERLLPRIDYIAADLGFERGDEAQSTLPQVSNFLLTRGFEIVGFEAGRVVVLYRNTRG